MSFGLSAADLVYDTLKLEIIRGLRRPGDPLRERDLAEHLGVSRTPLREALFRLEFEQLAERQPNGRLRVRPLSMRDIQDVNACRAELDCLATRFVIERASDEGITSLRRLLRPPKGADGTNKADVVARHVTDFYSELYQLADNSWLTSVAEPLRGQVERLTVIALAEYPQAELFTGLRTLYEAILRRDLNAAEVAVRDIASATVAALAETLSLAKGTDTAMLRESGRKARRARADRRRQAGSGSG